MGGGHHLDKKGFTLIELLAVIVILAIIALIATPIVLNIIKDSKISASERSAENYIDAVEQAISKKKMIDVSFNPTSCTISMVDTQSKLTCDGEELKVEINGSYPSSGTIMLSNGKLDKVSNLYIGGYYINKTDNKLVASKDAVMATICKAVTEATKTTGNVPQGNFDYGDEYTCELGDGIERTFFVLENGDTTTSTKGTNGRASAGEVALLMNQNICDDGTYPTETNKCTVAWSSDGLDTNGPDTAINYLHTATSKWTMIEQSEINLPFYFGQFAQLPNYNNYEVGPCFSTYPWAYDYLSSNGEAIHPINNLYGYWTMNDIGTIAADGSVWAYAVWNKYGCFDDPSNINSKYGVRPVITVSKTLIK